jgi:hypothetical protein
MMTVRAACKSQYHAALATLRKTIELCPEDLWLDPAPRNAYWQGAYHALFFGHLYLMPAESDFTPWEHHRKDIQDLGTSRDPYTRDQLLEYADLIDGMVDATLDEVDLDSSDCGFHWYDLPKLEHEILSIRHVQHHAAQLADRLRIHADIGVDWIGKISSPSA